MSTHPVHWREGMFLRPQHFQAADRYWGDQVWQTSRFDVHHNYGVRRIDIDESALKLNRFVVKSLQARMPDGTIVRVPHDGLLPELDLRPPAGAAESKLVEVFLAAPARREGGKNVGPAATDARFRVETQAGDGGVRDENDGETARPLEFRRLNLTLMSSYRDVAGFNTLKLAALTAAGLGDTSLQMHPGYIPPLLACEGWPALRDKILKPLNAKIGALVTTLGGLVEEKGVNFLSTEPESRRMFETLRLLNEASAVARTLARTDGVRPAAAYAELCRMVGQFAIFGPKRVCPDLHDYEHDDLGKCFFDAKRKLDELLNGTGIGLDYQKQDFVGDGLQLQVEIDPLWISPGWQMFVSVHSPLDAEDVYDLLDFRTGVLNMKIAAAGSRVERVYADGLPGLDFKPERFPPPNLPKVKGTTYFEVSRTEEEWPIVTAAKKLAIRLNDNLVQGSLQGQSQVMLRGQASADAWMKFTLYVIPPKG